MRKKRFEEPHLFDPGPKGPKRRKYGTPTRIWTANKARLISRYIYYFQIVTKHGTYIDGFAGPKDPKQPDAWAASLVQELDPLRLRHFHLCDVDHQKVLHLQELRDRFPDRDIYVYGGDFNTLVDTIVTPETVGPTEAAFCLLDQFTFECHWATVEKIARHKADASNKIEVFYFLAEWWIYQALGGIKSAEGEAKAAAWWGRDDWRKLQNMAGTDRAELVCQRFREECGYDFATPYAIYEKGKGRGRIAYYMIHATDHPAAPRLMRDAYQDAIDPPKPVDQITLELGLKSQDEG